VFALEASQLDATNRSVKVLMESLDLERPVLSASPIGLMQAALDIALPYVHRRKQFGVLIAHN
jgi:isovaleryl-CoA dehydrogenase